MHEDTNPIEILRKASALWAASTEQDDPTEHEDSNRDSVRYEQADSATAYGDTASRETGARRASNWVAKLHQYEEFWRTHRRAPRENTRDKASLPAEERRLGEWARHQRRFDDRLNSYQRVRLDVSPAFDWDPHDAQWQANYDACVVHLCATGELPRLHAADSVEFALARWLGRQLRQFKTQTLPVRRREPLTVLLTMRNAEPPQPVRR